VEALSFTVLGRVVQTDLSLALEAKARELGLTGWCRDDFDSVAGTVQGDAGRLQAFRTWLEAGVPGARIDVVDWETAVVRDDRTSFRRVVAARRD
jgi:acylphosphatase